MKKKLLKIIHNHFPESDNGNHNWQYVLDNCTFVPSDFYLYSKVKYYVFYFDKNNVINLSFVLYNNKEPVGVMPLIVRKDENQEWILTDNVLEILEPIFIKRNNY